MSEYIRVELTSFEAETLLFVAGNGYDAGAIFDGHGYGGKWNQNAYCRAVEKIGAAIRGEAPPAAPGMAWVRVEDEPPPLGVPVLVTNGRQTKIDMLLAGTNRRREKGPSVYEGEHIERVIETPAQSWENGATKDPNGMPAPLDYYTHWAPLPPAPETGEGR